MNFVNGRITRTDAGPVFVSGPVSVPLGAYAFKAGAPDGIEAILGIRPEHITVGGGETAGDARYVRLDGPVKLLEPTGADTIVWTEVAGQPFTIRVDAERQVRIGDTLPFSLDLTRASLFGAADGLRI